MVLLKTSFILYKLAKSPKSILLLGPRQVGKSILIESPQPALTINLGLQSEFLIFTSNPEEALKLTSSFKLKIELSRLNLKYLNP